MDKLLCFFKYRIFAITVSLGLPKLIVLMKNM